MASDSQLRSATVTMLRAAAYLLQARPDIPLPDISIDFYVQGPDAPDTMTAIAAALPCRWRASIHRSGGHEWLDLDSGPRPPGITRGARARIGAPTADVCAPAGATTVTVWRPAAALAAVIGTEPVGEVAR